jgi:predicted amidohydrolase YtcJ
MLFKNDKLGSLEIGKLADFVVLDQDYMTMPVDQISSIRPLMTFTNGKIVFER